MNDGARSRTPRSLLFSDGCMGAYCTDLSSGWTTQTEAALHEQCRGRTLSRHRCVHAGSIVVLVLRRQSAMLAIHEVSARASLKCQSRDQPPGVFNRNHRCPAGTVLSPCVPTGVCCLFEQARMHTDVGLSNCVVAGTAPMVGLCGSLKASPCSHHAVAYPSHASNEPQ